MLLAPRAREGAEECGGLHRPPLVSPQEKAVALPALTSACKVGVLLTCETVM